MTQKYTSIILGKIDIGETDRIYTIYTLEGGKLRVVAKGVRKPQAKLAGHLENFFLSDVFIAKGKGMGKITGAITEENFQLLREDPDIIMDVFKSISVFDRLVGDEEKDECLFRILLEYLDTANRSADYARFKIVNQGFIFKLLDVLGYQVRTDICASCQSQIKDKKNSFDPSLGGILCEGCSSERKLSVAASINAIKAMRIFSHNRIGSLVKLKIEHSELRELERISDSFIKWIV